MLLLTLNYLYHIQICIFLGVNLSKPSQLEYIAKLKLNLAHDSNQAAVFEDSLLETKYRLTSQS
uniref:Uncharacterized protein n=1 Tax=Tetranychus urticae TaxID=32264 RepID=T1K6P9_TETUR